MSKGAVQAVQAAHDEYVKAVGNHDAAGVAALYAKDARLLPPGEPMVTGRTAIETWGQGMFDMGVKSLELNELDIIDSGELTISVGAYRLVVEPPGADRMEDVGKYIEVYRSKADGSVEIILDTFNSDLPPAG